MSDPHDPPGTAPAVVSSPPEAAPPSAVVSAPLADVEPLDDIEDDASAAVQVEWYEDGGRKTALGAWAGVAVLSYAAMQLTGYFADWPFVALVSGAVGYFCVRGVAVVLGELKRRRS